jgi:hypothetical protein
MSSQLIAVGYGNAHILPFTKNEFQDVKINKNISTCMSPNSQFSHKNNLKKFV